MSAAEKLYHRKHVKMFRLRFKAENEYLMSPAATA